VLCGTPAPNAPDDLVGQVDLADLGVCFDGVELPDDRVAALPIVQRAISERGAYIRNLKRDVLPDLPRRRFTVVPVDLAPRQRAAYYAAAANLVRDLQAVDDHGFRSQLASFAARRSALLQLCSNPAGVLNGYAEDPAKLVALDQLVADLVADGEKVIVWSFYTASIEAICGRLAEHGVRRFDGTVTDTAVRREAVRAFQQDEGVRVMVANPAAAGAGLTLTASRYAIYESFSNQAAHFLQSLDRIHRRGQQREVEYLILLADGTLEEVEYRRLQDKERAAQDLLGDVVDQPLSREILLADLMGTGVAR
jgi:SNF2 family DNA or RNA helicase